MTLEQFLRSPLSQDERKALAFMLKRHPAPLCQRHLWLDQTVPGLDSSAAIQAFGLLQMRRLVSLRRLKHRISGSYIYLTRHAHAELSNLYSQGAIHVH